jgi:hypothetical protein
MIGAAIQTDTSGRESGRELGGANLLTFESMTANLPWGGWGVVWRFGRVG